MSKPFVAIVMGSDSDLPVMEASFQVLRSFDIPFEARVTSAHRTPEVTKAYVKDAEERGCAAFIAAAGMAALARGGVVHWPQAVRSRRRQHTSKLSRLHVALLGQAGFLELPVALKQLPSLVDMLRIGIARNSQMCRR